MADEVACLPSVEKSTDEKQIEEREKLDALVSDLSADYTKYLKVDDAAEKAAMDNEVEGIVTRLDELNALLDMVSGDNTLSINTTLAEIYKKCEGMERMFDKVDKLEKMVHKMKQTVDAMEAKVVEAEGELDNSSVKKLFSTLQKPLFPKKTSESKKQVKYEPPEIFKTEDFFTNQEKPSNVEKDET